MLTLMEVGETMNPARYALLLIKSLKLGIITNDQFDGLLQEFEAYCKSENIEIKIKYNNHD